jgi:predicted lipid-binding transport protein (Tim44 family)
VLGRRTGHERQRPDVFGRRGRDTEEKVVALPDRKREAPPPPPDAAIKLTGNREVDDGLRAIIAADRRFRLDEFMRGARAAYEMVVTAFAQGDRETLRMLLSDEVYGNFEAAIAEREAKHQTMQTSITAVRETEIVGAELVDGMAEVTVKFVSEMVSVTKDAEGNAVGGPPRPREVTDIWSFAREAKSSDPNWVLIETRSEH